MKHELSFIQFHSPLFSQGVNLGVKVDVKQRGAQVFWDDETAVIWLYFKGKASCLPVTSALSWDMVAIPGDVQEYLGLVTQHAEAAGPPFARRGIPPKDPVPELVPIYDESDESPEAHKARVRAASAGANTPPPRVQNDELIQAARNQAMQAKFHGATPSRAQVSTPHSQPAVQGKPKAISQAGMKAQVAHELKEPTPQ